MQQGAAAALWGAPIFLTTWSNMASNDENGAHMTASSTAALHSPYQAHDGGGGTWRANTTGGGSWLQVRFDTPRRATAYSMTNPGPTIQVSFDLLGSNDGSSWTTLDGGAFISSVGGGVSITNKAISNQTPFLYYRASVLSSQDAGATPQQADFPEWSFTFSAT